MNKDKYFGLSKRIARWKLDNPLENWLSYKADESDFWKNIYVKYYQLSDSEYYKGGVKFIEKCLMDLSVSDDDKAVVARDMVYCLHRFGFSFQDYCIYDFVKNHSLAYRKSFIADKMRYHYCDILNSPDVLLLMTNKYACYLEYKPFFQRDIVACFSADDYIKVWDFLDKHKEFIYKPLQEHSGHGINRYKTSEIDATDFLKNKLEDGPFVLEELIVQGTAMACIHPHSINSCRIVTFVVNEDNCKSIDIMGAAWRIGTGGSVVDNAGSGGLYASVDPKTGIVDTVARKYDGSCFEFHPDTGVKILGFKLPEWEKALKFIENVALYRKGTTLISWDIAYSQDGWVLVEANDNGDWSILQSNKCKGLKGTLYKHMDYYFNLKK